MSRPQLTQRQRTSLTYMKAMKRPMLTRPPSRCERCGRRPRLPMEWLEMHRLCRSCRESLERTLKLEFLGITDAPETVFSAPPVSDAGQ